MGKNKPCGNNLASATTTTKLRSPPDSPQLILDLSEIGKNDVRLSLATPTPMPKKVTARNRWPRAHERTCLTLPANVMPGA